MCGMLRKCDLPAFKATLNIKLINLLKLLTLTLNFKPDFSLQ